MKQGLTEAVCILDMTGSMADQTNDTLGGFNRFVEKQKEVPGECKFTVVLFNSFTVERGDKPWLNSVPVQEMPRLTTKEYVAAGNTPLCDVIGDTIIAVGKRLTDIPENERPEKVLVLIMTDGEENWSKKFTRAQIFEMIRHQREVYSWEFIFLGADLDSFDQAKDFGITHALNYCHDTSRAYNVASSALSSYRTSGKVGNIDDPGDKK